MNHLIVPEWFCFLRTDYVHCTAAVSWRIQCSVSRSYQLCKIRDQFSKNNLHFTKVVEFGPPKVLQLWHELNGTSQLNQEFCALDFYIFNVLSLVGNGDMLEALACHISQTQLDSAFCVRNYNAFYCACTEGHVSVLYFFTRRFSKQCLQAAFDANYFRIFRIACRDKNFSVIQYLIAQFDAQSINKAILHVNNSRFIINITWNIQSLLQVV